VGDVDGSEWVEGCFFIEVCCMGVFLYVLFGEFIVGVFFEFDFCFL